LFPNYCEFDQKLDHNIGFKEKFRKLMRIATLNDHKIDPRSPEQVRDAVVTLGHRLLRRRRRRRRPRRRQRGCRVASQPAKTLRQLHAILGKKIWRSGFTG
jgi:hypothetical protein